jgi:hypothetical protein
MSNINFFRVLQSGGVGGTPPPTWEVDDVDTNTIGTNNLPTSIIPSTQAIYPPTFIDASGIKLYAYDSINSKINHGNFANSWNVNSTVTYQESSPSGRFNFNPEGIGFKPDGTKFYALKQSIATAGDTFLYQSTLSTAWDISTMSTLSLEIQESESAKCAAFTLSSDGLTLWVITGTERSSTNSTIKSHKYTLSTAWDISTAGSPTVSNITSLWAGETVPLITALDFYPNAVDGNNILITGGSGHMVAFNNDLTTSNFQSDGGGYSLYAASSENLYAFQPSRTGGVGNFIWNIQLFNTNF